jgi:hypothetical protein
MSDQDELELYWGELGITRTRNLTPEELRERIAPGATRNDLVIGTSGNPLVIIKPNGQLEYGPQYVPDEAAVIFWESMARRRADYEQRMLLFAHMDALLNRVGRRDLEYERLQLESLDESLTDVDRAQREQFAELARRRLEIEVHQVIELGRGLVRREPVDLEPTQPYEGHEQPRSDGPGHTPERAADGSRAEERLEGPGQDGQ